MATTRQATSADLPFMVHILRLVAGGSAGPLPLDECRAHPVFSRYIDSWTPRQLGLICLDDHRALGAAWLVTMPADRPGRGFVAPGIPELVLGIIPDAQRRGHGSYLVSCLLAGARSHALTSMSAAVPLGDDVALTLLQDAGFSPVSTRDGQNVLLWAALSARA